MRHVLGDAKPDTQAAIQAAKATARRMMGQVDRDPTALADFVSADYRWRGVRPFYEKSGPDAVSKEVWQVLHLSLSDFHRREDIFLAGKNQHASGEIWVLSSGQFVGLFDHPLLGIPPTRTLVDIPFAEFHRVEGDTVVESALFLDLVRLQQQAGLDPFPLQKGARRSPSGPKTQDGILLEAQDPEETNVTEKLLDRMIADLVTANAAGAVPCPPDVLRRTWHENMGWYGPAGIGSVTTIPRYQEQHQTPFRTQLDDKVFNGHVCRIAEGHYSGWFGWPNLNNRNVGGYLGLPSSNALAEMRVVDIYRREGDKLAENWVYIDLLHYAAQHGIDLLENPNALNPLKNGTGSGIKGS